MDMLQRFITIFSESGDLIDEMMLDRHDIELIPFYIYKEIEGHKKQNVPVELADIFVTNNGDI